MHQTGELLYAGEALPHFNEVDECAGLDGLVTYRLWRQLGFDPENTLHDVRWGRQYRGDGIDDFVWVLEISGAVPPAHLVDGYAGAVGERQPPMYFRLGGASLKGVSKPGHIVWSRVFVANDRLQCDLGLGEVVSLPPEETQDRWNQTTPQWPIMHAVLKGMTRDQMMARHKANHIQVVYAPDAAGAQESNVRQGGGYAGAGPQSALLWRRSRKHPVVRALFSLALVLAVGAVFNADGAFFQWDTHRDMLRQVSVFGILACGMTMVIITGGIDLSVGSILGVCAVVFSLLSIHMGQPDIRRDRRDPRSSALHAAPSPGR